MLRQHLTRANEHFTQTHISAETQLLRKEVEQNLASTFDKVIVDSTFTFKYADIINLSPCPIGDHGYQDLLRSLSTPEHGLVLKRPQKDLGVLVNGDTQVTSMRDSFCPLPVDHQTLASSTRRQSLNLTRRNFAVWDRAAVPVPDREIPHLVHWIGKGPYVVRAITAADGGVMVIFGVDAHDYDTWRAEGRRLRQWYADRELMLDKFSLHTLVPISRESRGRGALLYLA